jgi:hypothetical protein
MHNDNTTWKLSKQIGWQSMLNKDRYLRPLVEEWCRRNSLPSADVSEWMTEDWRPDQPSPVEPNSLGYILVPNVLQLFTGDEVVEFFNKAYEALVPGGWLLVDVPSSDDVRTMTDSPNIKSYHNVDSFRWYCEKDYSKLDKRITCRFQTVHATNTIDESIPIEYQRMHVRADFCAIKTQRMPGEKLI